MIEHIMLSIAPKTRQDKNPTRALGGKDGFATSHKTNKTMEKQGNHLNESSRKSHHPQGAETPTFLTDHQSSFPKKTNPGRSCPSWTHGVVFSLIFVLFWCSILVSVNVRINEIQDIVCALFPNYNGPIPMICALVTLIILISVSVDLHGCLAVYQKVNARVPRPCGSRGLEPTKITLMHCLLFIFHKANFKVQVIKGLIHIMRVNYLPTPKVTENDVVHYILNTSLSLFTQFDTAGNGATQDGQIKATFNIHDFAFPLNVLEGKYDNTISVEFSIPAFNKGTSQLAAEHKRAINTLEGCSVQRFLFNDELIFCKTEQITILSSMVSTVMHPMIHSFNECVYSRKDEPELQQYPELFLHGQYLNEIAHEFPSFCHRITPDWFQSLLESNAKKDIPVHVHLLQMQDYSRFVRFLFLARKTLSRLMKTHGLNKHIDLEDLFITSIVHSTDHLFIGTPIEQFNLHHTHLPNEAWSNLITILFYSPPNNCFTNTLREKRHRTPFYKALFTALEEIDPFLAANVTLSISY
jgi:hypothetical protein